MLVQWVVFHTLVLVIVLKELLEMGMEPEERVCWATSLLILLEVCVFLRVSSVVWLKCQKWLRVVKIK